MHPYQSRLYLTDEKIAMEIVIISNNPDVWKTYPDALHVDGDPCDVLRTARDLVHQGGELFSHPFHGNMRLLRNPFRSMILKSDKGEIDSDSVLSIEESLSRLDSVTFDTRQESRDDYQYIDKDLLEKSFPI